MGQGAYQALLDWMGYPESETLRRLLSAAVNEEEVPLLLALPSTTPELAAKFNLDEKTIEAKLQNFKARGLIVPSRRGFNFPHDVMVLQDTVLSSLPEFIPSKLPQLFVDFYEDGWWRDLADASCKADKPFFRVIPAKGSVSDERLLLPWENINAIIEENQTLVVRDCACRVMTNACDLPKHVCIQFNRRADYVLERDSSNKALSKEETSEIASFAGKNALVPLVSNIANIKAINYICFCCDCCCTVLNPLKRADSFRKGLSPSRFSAYVDSKSCTGCKKCDKRCHFGAVSFENIPGSKKVKAKIDPEKCFGCGVCVLECKSGALKLELVRGPEHISSAL